MPISIDEQSEKLTEKIIEQSKSLISIKYWDNLTHSRLIKWLSNFKSKEEKYLAAVILHRLIFRNKQATLAMGKNIFNAILPQALEDNNIYTINDIKEWMQTINSTNKSRNLPFRISTIDNLDKKPAKSSSTIYNELKKEFFDGNLGWNNSKLSELPPHIKCLIFFDDIIGTGKQFETFYLERNMDKIEQKILYIPFAAVSESYKTLVNKYHNLIIIPVEVITEKHGLFCDDNRLFEKKGSFTHKDFRDFYLRFCHENNINIVDKLGKGDLALTYIFNGSTPNNNLAVLWHRADNNWENLFKR